MSYLARRSTRDENTNLGRNISSKTTASSRSGLADITNNAPRVSLGLKDGSSTYRAGSYAARSSANSGSITSRIAVPTTSRRSEVEAPAPKPVSVLPSNIRDIDLAESSNQFFVPQYADEVMQYMRKKEKRDQLQTNFMDIQRTVKEDLRAVLVDWFVGVALKFKLKSDTLYLAVSLLDRYLATSSISRSNLQITGICCLVLAAKYEEIYPPELQDFVYISDRACTKQQIIEMERSVIATLNFDLSTVTSRPFIRRFSKAANFDGKRELLATYFTELAMLDSTFARFLPSELAAAGVLLTQTMLGGSAWDATVSHYTQYKPEHLHACANALLSVAREAPESKHKQIYRKYAHAKYYEVATIPLPRDF